MCHGTNDPLALAQRRQIDASGFACERIQVSIGVPNHDLVVLGDDGHDERFDPARFARVLSARVLTIWVHSERLKTTGRINSLSALSRAAIRQRGPPHNDLSRW